MTSTVWLIAGAVFGALFVRVAYAIQSRTRPILFGGLVVASLAYMIFSVHGRAGAGWIGLELLGVAIYGSVAFPGLRGSPWWLAAGWALHPVWDIALHYFGGGAAFAPRPYALACLAWDPIVAVYIAYRIVHPARTMRRTLPKAVVYLVAFAALPLGVGYVGARSAFATYLGRAPEQLPASVLPPLPALDPEKPTVVVVLGNDVTEVADTLGPYVAFKTAGAFNVVTAAERRAPVALSGGLDVVPDFSFADLDAKLGRDPDLIIVPNIPNVRGNEAVRTWVREHGGRRSTVMSICAGAEMLAATGLIDGRPATTHWGDIARIERSYPAVRWVRGERYVDDGQFVSTAGILSGIDGSLHVIDRLRGRALALQVAQALHYDGARFLDDAAMPQFQRGPRDAIVLLNAAFGWDRASLGVPLENGIDELRLAAIYDTYAPSFALVSVASPGEIITTRHGLHLVARGTRQEWAASGGTVLSSAVDDQRFPFDAALEDVARRQDVPTAQFAAKRLEYRAVPPLAGRSWLRIAALYRPLLLGLLALVLVWKCARPKSRSSMSCA